MSFCVIAGISFTLAWVWHSMEQTASAEGLSPTPTHATPLSGGGNTESPTTQNAFQHTNTVPTNPQTSPPPAAHPDAVPESPEVSGSYFDDAIFFGDSISTGIPLYHFADNAAVVAYPGINTDNVNHAEVIDLGEHRSLTFLEAAQQYGPRGKVYILLGGNGLSFDKGAFISGYEQFVDSVRNLYPDAKIYLQSMTPVVEGYTNEFDPEYSNDKIDEYNLEILALAKRKGAYYLDVNSALKNATGALPQEASPVDGLHFTPEYYAKWFQYLKTHTVEDKK